MKTNLLAIGLGLMAGLPARAEETHVVAPGETLWAISRSHGVSVEQLRAQNGLRGDLIVVASRLVIPGKSKAVAATHTVAKGENLFRIGQRYGVAVGLLQEWNGLARPEDLRAGSVLRVDGPREAAPPAPVGETTPDLPEAADESAPGPVDEILEPVVLTENMRFGDLAAKHGMSVSQLNALNGWSFLKDDLLGAGTQVYVKH